MIPVVGAAADAANGIWYAASGDYVDAGISLAAAIPVVGDAALGAKYAIKGAKNAEEGLTAAKDLVHTAEAGKAAVRAGQAASAWSSTVFCLLTPSPRAGRVAARRRGSSRCGPVICAGPAWAGSRRWWRSRLAGGHLPRVRSWCSAIR